MERVSDSTSSTGGSAGMRLSAPYIQEYACMCVCVCVCMCIRVCVCVCVCVECVRGYVESEGECRSACVGMWSVRASVGVRA